MDYNFLVKNKKDLVFPYVCLVGGSGKSERVKKKFCLIEEKSERVKNVIYIN